MKNKLWYWMSVYILLTASACIAENYTEIRNNYVVNHTVLVSVSLLGESKETAASLETLVTLALQTSGVNARSVPRAKECTSPALADSRACLEATLRSLVDSELNAVFLPVPAANTPAGWLLRDAGLEELGDAAPPARRTCFVTRPPARSLLDFIDSSLAATYHVPIKNVNEAIQETATESTEKNSCDSTTCTTNIFIPEWCSNETFPCASLFTSDTSEASALSNVVRDHKLRARVFALGPQLAAVVNALHDRPLLICDWAPEFSPLANIQGQQLGPPPCGPEPNCPFETRRLVKYINVRSLARAPKAIRALVRLTLNATQLRDLTERSRVLTPETAAREFLAANPWRDPLREVRVAVLVPNVTQRQAFNAAELAAAAMLAEEQLESERIPRAARFKVEVYDDRCAATKAYKYLIDALGTGEYGSLSAVTGPACGAAFADVTRQSPAHALPVLAYTAQTPPSDARYALLAAGDAREGSAALGALLAGMGWKRLAAISEPATHALVDATRLHADVVVHFELPDDKPEIDGEVITEWARRVAATNAHIIYVSLEDARSVRAALCAGFVAGLTPAAGALWLLPSTLPPAWLQPIASDPLRCSREILEEMAEGHLAVAPHWFIAWNNNNSHTGSSWISRWRSHCHQHNQVRTGPEIPVAQGCTEAGPHAALLYDVLRLWATTLDRQLAERPAALDDLHDPALVISILKDATTTNYSGLTGEFKWSSNDEVHARVAPLLVLQWINGTPQEVGRWQDGVLSLQRDALRWKTRDGMIPDDGTETCALQGLAETLHADCRAAFITLSVLIISAIVIFLVAAALHCKRRVERKYRARLSALGLHSLNTKTIGLDRWEISRERVVINRKLGVGAFGTVYGGHALLTEDRAWTAVAVKTLKEGATTEEKVDFLSEAEAMKRFDHKNVVRLLGVVTRTEPVCTVMEFMLYGDLKNYLLARRHLAGEADEPGAADEVSPRRLTAMALDVARALSYLAQLRYVHRDVAARNCLVGSSRVVKLADFGMTRLVFENDYYRFSRKGMLPVRWMAPESLALGVFSPASDVWSFGVLLYEIATFGSLPFQGMSNREVLAHVKAGNTLELPPGLKPRLEGLIRSCWQQEYKQRPSACEITAFLADSPRLLTPCLDAPLGEPPAPSSVWGLPNDRAPARWVSWTAPASAATDTTYLSADADTGDGADMPHVEETDNFLP